MTAAKRKDSPRKAMNKVRQAILPRMKTIRHGLASARSGTATIRSAAATALLAAMTVLLTAACDRKTVYDRYIHTPQNGWEKNDTIVFAIDSLAQSGEYMEEIGVRTSTLYPFQSLVLVVQQTVRPSGIVLDTMLNCKLTDGNGQSQGAGISYRQFSFPLKTVRMEAGDTLRVAVRHNMKREILPGVSDIGLKITLK